MYKRKSFHACSQELLQASQQFRSAYLSPNLIDLERTNILNSTSMTGVEILNIISLSVRRGADYGQITISRENFVGSIKQNITSDEAEYFKNHYFNLRSSNSELERVNIRTALNKIAHFDERSSSFYVNDVTHELLLIGKSPGNSSRGYWVCIIDVNKFCSEIQNLPDVNI